MLSSMLMYACAIFIAFAVMPCIIVMLMVLSVEILKVITKITGSEG